MLQATFDAARANKLSQLAINTFLATLQDDEGSYPASVSLPDLITIQKNLETLAADPDASIQTVITEQPLAFRNAIKEALETRLGALQTEFDALQDPEL